MGKRHVQKRFSRTAFTLGSLFLLVICLYTLFFVYPSYRAFGQTRQAILEQTERLDRLKILYPVFGRSKTLNLIQFEHQLPFPARVQIHRNELANLSKKISDIAKRNQMTLSGSDFDINSLKNKSQFVSLTIKLSGELFDFRRFLIEIISFEFFDSIENLTVSTDKDQMKKFTLNLNLKIKQNPS